MGGGGWYYVPKVWTPYGGWWADPKHWKRSTSMAGVAVGFSFLYLFSVSIERERRPIAPASHIPSQKWCKYAKVDDPSLQ
ncbi:hypothetical protein IV203_001948 [Nitzschia inconspicua]|uniref:Uncharacterized protein n=1 Tax=Nitzschia inconspicua TaxID=303405 RepID=A0A9K3L7P0_9STRA|nr:hypothetical protein IV203_001948 [Nitzschia inconspicua]